MGRKQDTKLELVGTRVPTDVRDDFRRIASNEFRSVSAELRRMIEERIAADRRIAESDREAA